MKGRTDKFVIQRVLWLMLLALNCMFGVAAAMQSNIRHLTELMLGAYIATLIMLMYLYIKWYPALDTEEKGAE